MNLVMYPVLVIKIPCVVVKIDGSSLKLVCYFVESIWYYVLLYQGQRLHSDMDARILLTK